MTKSPQEFRAFPRDILVDATKSKEAVFVHPDASIYADTSVAAAFDAMNDRYAADPEARIRFMASSVSRMRVPGTLGWRAPVNIALMSGEKDADSSHLLFLTSPLNDGKPKSSADRMIRYINTDKPGFWDIALTQPNSWNPVTKLDIGYEFINDSGRNMSVLQMFSRVPPRALSLNERRLMWAGDYSGFGRIALQAVRMVNQQRQQNGQKPVETVHFFGAGMGQRALGAAAYFIKEQDEFQVGSATVQNLGLHRGPGAAKDHLRQSQINEPSRVIIPETHVRIDEPQLRKDIDRRGTDSLQLLGRQARAIADLSYMKAFMFDYRPTVEDVITIMDNETPVRIVNALNAGMNANTLHYLPIGDPGLKLSTIVGMEGQKVGEMSNEHAGVTAISMSLGIRDYDLRQAA